MKPASSNPHPFHRALPDPISVSTYLDDERQKQREAMRNNNPRDNRPASAPIPVSKPAASVPTKLPTGPHGLPPKPTFDMFLAPEPAIPAVSPVTVTSPPTSLETGSNHDVVMNRKAIRMANMSAAEALKAELHGLTPLGRNAPPAPVTTVPTPSTAMEDVVATSDTATPSEAVPEAPETPQPDVSQNGETAVGDDEVEANGADVSIGLKRKADEMEADAEGEDDVGDDPDDLPEVPITKKTKTEEHDDIK